MPNYYSTKDVANITGKKVKTVWRWCQKGLLKASKPGGRDYIIKDTDLQEFLESGHKTASTDTSERK